MDNLSTERARAGLEFLTDIALARENELSRFESAAQLIEDCDEEDSDCPIYMSFYTAGGSEAIMKMTNFSARRFEKIYNNFHEFIVTNWNVGRGKKSNFRPKDVFFMMMTTFKYGTSWDQVGNVFKI